MFANIPVPRTVHIPDPLLKSVDRRAKALGISRNRLVVRALEQAVSVQEGWSPEFMRRLRHVDEWLASRRHGALRSRASCDLRSGHQRRLRTHEGERGRR
jgi:predicted transcriptional regulator